VRVKVSPEGEGAARDFLFVLTGSASILNLDLVSDIKRSPILGLFSNFEHGRVCMSGRLKCLVNPSIICFVVILVFTCSASAEPQVTTGTIDGTVMDQSGAVVPNVDLTLKNLETGLTRTSVTDERGNFRAPLLPLGTYEVSVTFSGFSPFKQTVLLTVGQTATLAIHLAVSAATQAVSVTAESPLIESSRTQVSSTVDSLAVANLPVNGRNFIDFVLLTPGVTRDIRTGDISFAGQR
jgi:carboxypeptidase family protein